MISVIIVRSQALITVASAAVVTALEKSKFDEIQATFCSGKRPLRRFALDGARLLETLLRLGRLTRLPFATGILMDPQNPHSNRLPRNSVESELRKPQKRSLASERIVFSLQDGAIILVRMIGRRTASSAC